MTDQSSAWNRATDLIHIDLFDCTVARGFGGQLTKFLQIHEQQCWGIQFRPKLKPKHVPDA